MQSHARTATGAPSPRGLDPLASRPHPHADGDGWLLHAAFEARADARPEGVAVSYGTFRTTYATLERRANRLARHLRRRGIGRGDVVALLLPRSVDAYVALLGILKAGAAYLPIDPDHPFERVRWMLADGGAKALVTTEALAGRHRLAVGTVVLVDADDVAISAESGARLGPSEVGLDPHDLCYVMYTSGSSGRPKGVRIEHRSAWHLAVTEGRLFGVRPDDRVYQGASLAFDLSVEEIWLALQAGATLVPAAPGAPNTGAALSRELAKRGVTVFSCVPSLLATMDEDVPHLRLLIVGGEILSDRLAERWTRPGRRVVNTYGPTETTVTATYADVVPGHPVTIGRPLPGYHVYLLDDDQSPVAPGCVGEIVIGGVGVARGYVGRERDGDEHFVADPFAPPSQSGAQLCRTGDLGWRDDRGNLHFIGRADDQVKLDGYRVELGEVESALLEVGGFRGAACAVREDVQGAHRLHAWVVPVPGASFDERWLRRRLARMLPPYMVPERVESIAELPRLPNGKLDRAALPWSTARAPEEPSEPPAVSWVILAAAALYWSAPWVVLVVLLAMGSSLVASVAGAMLAWAVLPLAFLGALAVDRLLDRGVRR